MGLYSVKKYPKIVQADTRGQIVIPKDIRQELNLDEGSAFWLYSIEGEGIFLKKIDQTTLSEQDPAIQELLEKKHKLNINEKNIHKTIRKYKQGGKLEELWTKKQKSASSHSSF